MINERDTHLLGAVVCRYTCRGRSTH